MIRAQILFKQVFREMIVIMHPQAISPVKVGGSVVPNRIVFAVLAFLSIYIASIASMTLILTLSGLDLVTALSAVVACINNLGPGFGPATTFSVLTDFQIWVCSFAMLLGRLELFTLLIVFTPAFWRK
jgi:trk system potassium uptake protein TrkH